MPEVVIGRCHGGWEKSYGFAEVPPGTRLFLFNNGLNTMAASRADGLLLSSHDGIVASQAEATEVIEPGTGIFNFMTQDLSGDDVVWEGPLDRDIELIQGGWTLQQVFDNYAGNNIYWFACTSRVRSPAFDWTAVQARNQAVLKALDDGETVTFLQYGNAVLIGEGHGFESVEMVGLRDYCEGTIQIKKGGMFGSGKIYVWGSHDTASFEEHIAQFSDKTVEFQ